MATQTTYRRLAAPAVEAAPFLGEVTAGDVEARSVAPDPDISRWDTDGGQPARMSATGRGGRR
ncbi:hypothetical protein GCM10027517_21680 [Phycicoccus ginsengisoli]